MKPDNPKGGPGTNQHAVKPGAVTPAQPRAATQGTRQGAANAADPAPAIRSLVARGELRLERPTTGALKTDFDQARRDLRSVDFKLGNEDFIGAVRDSEAAFFNATSGHMRSLGVAPVQAGTTHETMIVYLREVCSDFIDEGEIKAVAAVKNLRNKTGYRFGQNKDQLVIKPLTAETARAAVGAVVDKLIGDVTARIPDWDA